MRTLRYPSINGEFSARLSVGSDFSGLAESNERIGIEHYRLQDDAVALRLGHSALREQLPLIEARPGPCARLHDFPDTLIVLASKPRSKVCHSDVPPLEFSLKNHSLPQAPIAVSSWKLAIRGSRWDYTGSEGRKLSLRSPAVKSS